MSEPRIGELPPTRPVSAADARLRETVGELMVHVPCGGIRGPIGRIYSRCDCAVNRGRWQSCSCEDEPVRWDGADVSREVDLCILCARGTAGGTTRWSAEGCQNCRDANDAAGLLLGVRPVALYRHSIRNGAGIRALAAGEEFRRQHAGVVAVTRSWEDLGAWFPLEFARVAAANGWAGKNHVLLRTWKEQVPASAEASRDALRRFCGVDLSG